MASSVADAIVATLRASGVRLVYGIPGAPGIPYAYWSIGFTGRQTYRAAEKEGHLEHLPTNRSPRFLPPMQPCLRTGTAALVTAAPTWLARH